MILKPGHWLGRARRWGGWIGLVLVIIALFAALLIWLRATADSRSGFDGIGEAADIAAADNWPGGSPDPETEHLDPGTNAVVIRTEAGMRLAEAAASDAENATQLQTKSPSASAPSASPKADGTPTHSKPTRPSRTWVSRTPSSKRWTSWGSSTQPRSRRRSFPWR